MILDTSVIIAVALREPGYEEVVNKLRHPASLNLGDCLSYAAARVAGHPLLFVGGDFSRTDIEAA